MIIEKNAEVIQINGHLYKKVWCNTFAHYTCEKTDDLRKFWIKEIPFKMANTDVAFESISHSELSAKYATEIEEIFNENNYKTLDLSAYRSILKKAELIYVSDHLFILKNGNKLSEIEVDFPFDDQIGLTPNLVGVIKYFSTRRSSLYRSSFIMTSKMNVFEFLYPNHF